MNKQTDHQTPNLFFILVLLLCVAGIGMTAYMFGVGVNRGSEADMSVAQVPHARVVGEPTEGPATPYPRKPGEPQVGEVPPPTLMPNYPVPAMTPVPIGVDPDFDQNPTLAVGYTPAPTPRPSDPINVGAITEDWLDAIGKTLASVNVVRGTVTQIQPARWSTNDGNRPANPRAPGSPYVIFRPVLIMVSSYLKGSGPQNVMVMAFGGTVGQDTATWGDSRHTFSVGDEVILFLNNEGTNPELIIDGYFPWFIIGRYTINGSEATDGLQVMPLRVLLDKIAGAQK